MIIYRDLISHDEMFSDIYKIREIADGLCLEVERKMVSRTEGNIDDSLIGGNASAEGPEGEGTESTVITGVGYCHEPSPAGNKFHKRSLQEVHQRLHEIGLQNKSSTSLLISKTTSSLLVKT
uniref:Translationally-controlled tumor protein n=1 Tax=Papio anubis TaxID=9555 RepID=A0A2I3NEP1_PAPAN